MTALRRHDNEMRFLGLDQFSVLRTLEHLEVDSTRAIRWAVVAVSVFNAPIPEIREIGFR